MFIFSIIRAKHNLIFKLSIVLFCSFFLALMLPNKEIKGHRVDGFNAIWPYPDLVILEDFYVNKTKDEIKIEKQLLVKDCPFFFVLNTDERELKIKLFEKLKLTNELAYNELKPLIDSIYLKGVIENLEDTKESATIFIKQGSYEEMAFYNDFFTVSKAVNFLKNKIEEKKLKVNYLDFITITYYLSKEKTEEYLQSKLEQISVFKNSIKKGDILVKQDEVLTNEKRLMINNYFNFQNKNTSISFLQFIAKWSLTFILCLVLLLFLAFFRLPIFGQNKQVAFLFLLLVFSVLAVFIFDKYGLMIFALPFALVPILVRVFFDSRTALFTYLIVVLVCTFFISNKLEFMILQLISGIGTLFVVAEMRKRQQILNAAFVVLLFYIILFISFHIGFGSSQVVKKLTSYLPFVISATLVLLAYPLIFLIEKIFSFISDFKLLELCDLNQPLLRKLSQEVPGTFQHSLQVANLAEEAIYYIGGNTLLVRAGAMYHDIGKIINSNYFNENQANGYSPHQEIDPVESSKIIINHVIFGIELAKQHHLPEQIIDFIRTHHGTTQVRYFLKIFQKDSINSENIHSQFNYPGPIPFSKETAVLMLADGVEAASRSLKKKDSNTINDLVDSIIDYKIVANQFVNSDITFKDITLIKKIFKKRLMTIYHARIEYPK